MHKLFLMFLGVVAAAGAQAKPHAPVALKLQTLQQLQPGQPGDVLVTVTPLAATEHLRVLFRGEEGLTVQGNESHTTTAPAVGVPLAYHVTLVGAHEGLFHLTAVATAQIAGRTTNRVVSLQVLVGNPAKVQKAEVVQPTQIDSTGQRIRSMPAQERPSQSR